jgi:predicted DsbA family dithiol-disulfide isomerase
MTLKQNFAEQLKAQSDIWRAQAKDYQEHMEQAGEQVRVEHKKAMEQMETKIQDAAKLAEQVRSANEAAWKDMVSASQKAFVELQRGWADAVSRFQ